MPGKLSDLLGRDQSGNPQRWDSANIAFYNDFRAQLEGDKIYQAEPTVDQFVYLFEKTITQ